MAATLTVFLPTNSLSGEILNSGNRISCVLNFPSRDFFGASKDLGLRFLSKTIPDSYLSERMPRYKLLQIRAGISPGDGGGGSKPGYLSSKKPEDAGQLPDDCDGNQNEKGRAISIYGWSAGLAALGVIETAYLTYMKVTDSDVYCPVGGGSCGDVLNSDYATVFGVPLPLIGMIGYGVVALLGLQLARRNMVFGVDGDRARWFLLGSTSAMAVASGYFMYLLTIKLEGASCAYCVASALLSFSLLLITLRDFSLKEVQQVASIQITTSALVIAALSTAYSTSGSAQAGEDKKVVIEDMLDVNFEFQDVAGIHEDGYLQYCLQDLHHNQIGPTMIYYTFCMVKNQDLHTRMKNIKFKDHYFQELLQQRHHYGIEAED